MSHIAVPSYVYECCPTRHEVLLTIGGCHSEPCRLIVNVARTDPRGFEREFRNKLIEALDKHAAA